MKEIADRLADHQGLGSLEKCECGSSFSNLRVGIESNHDVDILQRVLLDSWSALLLGRSDNSLDLVRVDDPGQISVLHQISGQNVRRIDLVECLEGRLGPDTEAAEVPARGQVEQVETAHVEQRYSGQVAERLADALVLLVDDQGSFPHGVTTVPDLTNTSSHLFGFLGFFDIVISTNRFEQLNSLLGFAHSFNTSFNNTRNLSNLINFVSSGHHKGGKGGSSDS